MEEEKLGEQNIFYFTKATYYNGFQHSFAGRTGQSAGIYESLDVDSIHSC